MANNNKAITFANSFLGQLTEKQLTGGFEFIVAPGNTVTIPNNWTGVALCLPRMNDALSVNDNIDKTSFVVEFPNVLLLVRYAYNNPLGGANYIYKKLILTAKSY